MVGGTAGHNIDLVQSADIVRADAQILQHHPAVLDPGEQALAQGVGLLHDLLDHEVLIAALLRGGDLPVHGGVFLLHWVQQAVIDLDAVSGEDGNFPVLHVGHVPGVLDDSGDVAGQKVAAVPVAQHQGAVLPGGDDLVGIVHADDAQGIGALNLVQGLDHRLQDVVGVVVVHQLGRHFGVGLGGEVNALGLQPVAQSKVVFNDAVVDHGNAAGLAHMGMGVQIRGLAMGGPAGVAQAHMAVDVGTAVDQIIERFQSPLGLIHLQPVLLIVHRDARGIISSVLQTGQALQQNRGGLLLAHETDNSTHKDITSKKTRK